VARGALVVVVIERYFPSRSQATFDGFSRSRKDHHSQGDKAQPKEDDAHYVERGVVLQHVHERRVRFGVARMPVRTERRNGVGRHQGKVARGILAARI